jgi:hypothetical protein
MELWRIWEFVFACAALLLNLFCAVIYGRLFSQRRRAIGFAFLAITCAVLVLTNAFSVIVQIRGTFGVWVFSKPTVRFLHSLQMCLSALSLITGFIAPVYISRYVLDQTKA